MSMESRTKTFVTGGAGFIDNSDAKGMAITKNGTCPVFLITILYNSERYIRTFLECLLRQDKMDWNLIVVDNASADGSRGVVERVSDSRITLLRNEVNTGFARAANQGLRHAYRHGGKFFIVINNDIEFQPDFLRAFVQARSDRAADVITPKIMSLTDPNLTWYAGGYISNEWIFDGKGISESAAWRERSKTREIDFAPGCCLGLTATFIETVGIFDESFFVYWEDLDLCLRMKEKKIRIHYIDELTIRHVGGGSSGGEFSPSYVRLFYRSNMQLLRKHFGIAKAIADALRLIRREFGREKRNWPFIAQLSLALLRGVFAPLKGAQKSTL